MKRNQRPPIAPDVSDNRLQTQPMTWAFLAGEYPPQPGGVADYTWSLAHALAALGDNVHVYAPPAHMPDPSDEVHVHRLADRFGPGSLFGLIAALRKLPEPRRVVVQYVVQSFGMRALNFPFALALLALRRDDVWVMFHEYAIVDDVRRSLPQRAQALGTRWMARLVANAAGRAFVSTPAWSPLISKDAPRMKNITWLPVPSNVPTGYSAAVSPEHVRAQLVIPPGAHVMGHFGTYRMQKTCRLLETLVPELLRPDQSRRFLLIGRGGQAFSNSLTARFPELRGQIIATDELIPESLAAHLGACDILVQPYEDGVTTRRGSLIAGLALGVPIVSTAGVLTEDFWKPAQAVLLAQPEDAPGTIRLVEQLIRDAAGRARLGAKARELYEQRFALTHTVRAFRER